MAMCPGVALWKLGKVAEALPILESVARGRPHELFAVCNCGTLLAELGRHDEAMELLRTGDHLFSSQRWFGGWDLEQRERMLEDFRVKVVAARV